MTEENLLKAADALLKTSETIQKESFRSAAQLAEEVYYQQVEVMRAFARSESQWINH